MTHPRVTTVTAILFCLRLAVVVTTSLIVQSSPAPRQDFRALMTLVVLIPNYAKGLARFILIGLLGAASLVAAALARRESSERYRWISTFLAGVAACFLAFQAIDRLPWILGSGPPDPTADILEYAKWVSHPERLEQASYVAALLLPPILFLGLLKLSERLYVRREPSATGRIFVAQAVLAGQSLVAFAVLKSIYHNMIESDATRFGEGITLIGLFIALFSGWWLLRQSPVSEEVHKTARPHRYVALGVAVLAALVAILPALHRDDALTPVPGWFTYHLAATLDEYAAPVNGAFPLVDFFPQYNNLLPLLVFPILKLIGVSVTHFTVLMGILTLTGFLLVFAGFSRMSQRPWLAVVGFLSFLGLTISPIGGQLSQGESYTTYFAVIPMRYFAGYLTFFLCCWTWAKPSSARVWVALLGGAACALNNFDFGIPAFVGLTLAVGWQPASSTKAVFVGLLRAVGRAAAALALVVVVFSLLALVTKGSLPRFGWAFAFQKAFAVSGYGMLPMPPFGLHHLIYLNIIACVLVGIAPVALGVTENRMERLASGICIMTGVFAAGAGMYYVGRSHADLLKSTFSAWALAATALLWRVSMWIQTIRSHKPGDLRWAAFLVLLCLPFGLGLIGVVDARNPWRQVERIATSTPGANPLWPLKAQTEFIRRTLKEQDRAVIVAGPAHQLGELAGVKNVFPFAFPDSVLTKRQLAITIAAIVRSKADVVYASEKNHPTVPLIFDGLAAHGFYVESKTDGPLEIWRRRHP
jgi:hypothetical protein